MISQEIRRNFLSYFKNKGHSIIASSSVVPHEDPTLLFTNAGMNQFKDVFLGKAGRDYSRAATSQKCIRVGGKHNDLDNVGHTTRHLTFFEMLGNFSFGDYFKEKAIEYAWEVSTQVFGFPEDKIWITIFETDEEAFEYWKKIVPEKRIVRMGEKDNFWAMGDTGPCGPCTELYFDRGPKLGQEGVMEGERYLEFWNLVFMQYNRDQAGKFNKLPKQSIDTGSGLERVVSLKMGVDNVFETDIFRNLIAQIEQVSGKKYDKMNPQHAAAYHVIADHIRSLSFAIADGAQPSNIERGYVLRKILRRAVRYGKALDMHEPFLAKVLPRLVDIMGPDYPELVSSQNRIAEILTVEEEAFFRTLKRGGNILQQVIDKAHKSPLKQISGEEAFKLKDTYGFPLEEILLIAKDTALEVNLDAYQLLEEKAKEKSRSAQAVHSQEIESNLFKDFAEKSGKCLFTGYSKTKDEGSILALVHEGQFVNELRHGQEGLVILNKTPFYAEKGGQIGDTGTLSHHKALFKVTGCHSPYADVIVHIGSVDRGELIVGEPLVAEVDEGRRKKIANNHTATHLLHYALEKVLGAHIKQAGSLVEDKKFRFDFNHHKPVTPEELIQIERMINEKIRNNTPVQTYELSYEEAQKRSDIKQFFGDKYGSKVRVIDIDFSKELCGGTHTHHIGTIGLFRITKESSIASGVRRIEAVTGVEAEEFMYAQEAQLNQASSLLKTPSQKLIEKLQSVLEENKLLSSQLKAFKKSAVKQLGKDLLDKAKKIGSSQLIMEIVPVEGEDIATLMEDLGRPNAVIILATKADDKCNLFIRVGAELVKKGIEAGALIKEMAPAIGGKGGGKADSAQAGGNNPQGLTQAFASAQKVVESKC